MRSKKKKEQEYAAVLAREEPIKTEVIIELRAQNKELWESQAAILRALIESQESLLRFRRWTLENAERARASESCCIPGCVKHVWDSGDGWHRASRTEE